MSKNRDNNEIFKASRTGEMGVNGEPVPESNLDDIYNYMLGRKQNLNFSGIAHFLWELRQVAVRGSELSVNEFNKIYKFAKPHVRIQSRLVALNEHEQVGTEDAH